MTAIHHDIGGGSEFNFAMMEASDVETDSSLQFNSATDGMEQSFMDLFGPETCGTNSSSRADLPSCPNGTCIALVAATLNALHESVEGCLSRAQADTHFAQAGIIPPRKMGTVLGSNTQAIHALSRPLECNYCRSQPQLLLMVIAALHKILNWYRAISQSIRATERGNYEERVEKQSITIGDHHIDSALTSPILAQVVLHQLRELENVFDVVSQLMSASSRADGSSNPGRGKSGSPSSHRLPEFLKEGFVEYLRRRSRYIREELGCL